MRDAPERAPRRVVVTAGQAALFVVLASLAFATSGPLGRYARPADPVVIAFGRVLLAGALLFAVDARAVLRSFRALTASKRRLVAAAGALLGAHFALFFAGLDHTSLPAAVALVSLEPLAVVASAWAIFGLRPSRKEGLGVLLATAGAVVIGSASGSGEHTLFGDALVVAAVALFGVYVSIARLCRDALPARHYAALVYLAAAAPLAAWLASAALFAGDAESLALPPHATIAIVLLALIPTIFGHTAVQTAARHLSPSIVSLVSPGETLGAIALGALFLSAAPTAVELAGATVIVCGSAITLLAQRRVAS